MIKFRACGLLAAFFLFNAFNYFSGHCWGQAIFHLIIGICMVACYLQKPLRIGNLIEFGGW